MMDSWKSDAIRAAQEQLDARRVEEVKIAQKVGAAHRAAFAEKFPGQVEHCMRLIAERLQRGLLKDAEISISDKDAHDLSQALCSLYYLHQDLTQD